MNDFSYTNWSSMSDQALSESIGRFINHHRLEQNLSQTYIATQAGISRSTLSLLERGGKVTLATLLQVLRVLDLLYVLDTFRVNKTVSPIAYAKLQKQQRKRASGMVAEPSEEEDLGW